jgi:hypothetical protein
MDAPDLEGTRSIMTTAFLHLSPDERKLYIDEAAARRGLSPVILEKDFWVCHPSRRLKAYRLKRRWIKIKPGTWALNRNRTAQCDSHSPEPWMLVT